VTSNRYPEALSGTSKRLERQTESFNVLYMADCLGSPISTKDQRPAYLYIRVSIAGFRHSLELQTYLPNRASQLSEPWTRLAELAESGLDLAIKRPLRQPSCITVTCQRERVDPDV
jgi:hypothetical protein